MMRLRIIQNGIQAKRRKILREKSNNRFTTRHHAVIQIVLISTNGMRPRKSIWALFFEVS